MEFVPLSHPTQATQQYEAMNELNQASECLKKFLESYTLSLGLICLFPKDFSKHFQAIEIAFKHCITNNVCLTKAVLEEMAKINIEKAILHKSFSELSSKFCCHIDALLFENPTLTKINLLLEEVSIVHMYKYFINLITELCFEESLATQGFLNFCCVISDYFVTAKNRNNQPYPFLGQALVRLLYEYLNSSDSIDRVMFVLERFEFSFNTLLLSEEYNKEHLYRLKSLLESRMRDEDPENEKHKMLSKILDMIITIDFNQNAAHANTDCLLLPNEARDCSDVEKDEPVCCDEEWDDFLDQFGDPVCDPPELSNLGDTAVAANSHSLES